jgi:serine phosphatase RsbU (regulator of sigma subunit)
MTGPAVLASPVIAWAWAGTGLEPESGDLHAVVAFPGGATVALIDGIGHGREAASAARAAAAVLDAYPGAAPDALFQRCHAALRTMRGAVMTIAAFGTAASSMTWLAVGNVDGVLFRGNGQPAETVIPRGGVVGYQLPALRSSTVSVAPGDTVILTTDGIRDGFTTELDLAHDPQLIAESILARFARGSDDAHVVVARYLGDGR